MSRLRPELKSTTSENLSDETVLFLVRDAVERQRGLIAGALHRHGMHCAMGAFWKDNPGAIVSTRLVDEVATVNDSLPPTATPKERWLKVRSWLRWKLRMLANAHPERLERQPVNTPRRKKKVPA